MKRLKCVTVYDVGKVFDITVTGDVAGVVTLPKQIKFAGAKSLNDTGNIAVDTAIGDLNRGLHIRRNWLRPKTKFGINRKQASFGKETAETQIYTNADWLLEEEGFHGGVKTPDRPGHPDLTIPDVPNIRGNIDNVVSAAKKAGRLLAGQNGRISLKTGKLIGKTGAFKINSKDGRTFIFQRVGTRNGEEKRNKKGTPLRGRIRRGESKLLLLYTFKHSVKVPEKFIFQKAVENTYQVHYGDQFGINLKGALRGARK